MIVQDTQWITRRQLTLDELTKWTRTIGTVHSEGVDRRCKPGCVSLSAIHIDNRLAGDFFCTFWWLAQTKPFPLHLQRTDFGDLLSPDEAAQPHFVLK